MITKLLCIITLLSGAAIGAGELASAQITFKVHDDFGKPVEGVTVGMSTFERSEPGSGFGRDVHKTVTGITDRDGQVTLRSVSLTGEFAYGISPHPSFYHTRGFRYKFDSIKDGKWQPWNPAVEFEVKPVVKPIPMYAKRLETHIKRPNQKYGFDLMIGDWVAPDGKGRDADIFFEVVGYWNSFKDYDSTLIVSFANQHDGVQVFQAAPSGRGSVFRSPRYAP
jgi:hypothetical protein